MEFIPKCDELFEALYQWNLDKDMREAQNGYSIPSSRGHCFGFYDALYDGTDNILLGVVGDSGEIVGAFMIEDIDRDNLNCEMHFVFSPEGRSKVFKTACSKVIDFVFNELNIVKVYGKIAIDNLNANVFVSRMGWTKLCVLESYYKTAKGFMDANLYVLTPRTRVF